MNEVLRILSKCILFEGISEDNTQQVLSKIDYKIMDYDKASLIALEDDTCNNIGVVIKGVLEIQKNYSSGRSVTFTQLSSGDIFGEVIVFSQQNKYPADIVSTQKSKVLFIDKKEIIKLCSENRIILENFMRLLSNKIWLLNKKVKELSFESIRKKICNFLMEQYSKQQTMFLKIPYSRKNLSELMGIQRPSLSRELMKMRDEEIIDFDKDVIKIKNIELLKKYI